MIESFKIDHTQLEPGIRLAAIYHRDGVDVVKFDIRMIKPNTEYFQDDIMHSMEHLMATAAKEVFGDDMIDLSPMGCKTGFYLTIFANEYTEDVEKIKKMLKISGNAEIPVPDEHNCGSYKLHDIEGAREYLNGKFNSSSNS